jgi:hypothetical protein
MELHVSKYTQILLDGSEKSVRNTVNLLNNFTKISGLKVNYNKSELAPLGFQIKSSFFYSTTE